MRTPRVRRGAACVALALLLPVALAGCSADVPGPGVSAPPVASRTPGPSPSVFVPADGVSLRSLGFTNGPVDRVFVPTDASVTSRVDQADDVTLVITSPAASALAAFYRRTAVANGFTVTAENEQATTLTFTGFGWMGTFTGDVQASALLLRPAP